MAIKTQSAKAKGRELQKRIAKKITESFHLEEGDVESRSMGAGGVDIILSPRARREFPISIECKNTRKTPALAELVQAKANAYARTLPAVVWKPHRAPYEDAIIMARFDDFVAWVKDVCESIL